MLDKLKQGQMVEITVEEMDDFGNLEINTYKAEYRGRDVEFEHRVFHINDNIYIFHEHDIKKIVKK